MLSFADDFLSPDQFQTIQDSPGLKVPSVEELKEMVSSLLAKANQGEIAPQDHETLCESVLFQYAYLENLLKTCREEKNPNGEVA